MNDFEIKAALKNLKDLGLINVYKVVYEYSMREEGDSHSDLVVEIEYRGINYLTEVIFDNYSDGYEPSGTSGEGKMETLKEAIESQREDVESYVYCNSYSDFHKPEFEMFVDEQIDLKMTIIKEKRPLPRCEKIEPQWRDKVCVREFQKNNVDLYRDIIQKAEAEMV